MESRRSPHEGILYQFPAGCVFGHDSDLLRRTKFSSNEKGSQTHSYKLLQHIRSGSQAVIAEVERIKQPSAHTGDKSVADIQDDAKGPATISQSFTEALLRPFRIFSAAKDLSESVRSDSDAAHFVTSPNLSGTFPKLNAGSETTERLVAKIQRLDDAALREAEILRRLSSNGSEVAASLFPPLYDSFVSVGTSTSLSVPPSQHSQDSETETETETETEGKREKLTETEKEAFAVILMPFRGRALSYFAKEYGQFPLPLVRSIVAQVSVAVAGLANQGIVHSGLKPEDILLRRDSPFLCLTDFNSAQFLPGKLIHGDDNGEDNDVDHLDRLTALKKLTQDVGDGDGGELSDYASPEIVHRMMDRKTLDRHTLDPHTSLESEVYAIGILALTLALGHSPASLLRLSHPPQAALFHATKKNFLKHLIDQMIVEQVLDERAADFIRKCASFNPGDRPVIPDLLTQPWFRPIGEFPSTEPAENMRKILNCSELHLSAESLRSLVAPSSNLYRSVAGKNVAAVAKARVIAHRLVARATLLTIAEEKEEEEEKEKEEKQKEEAAVAEDNDGTQSEETNVMKVEAIKGLTGDDNASDSGQVIRTGRVLATGDLDASVEDQEKANQYLSLCKRFNELNQLNQLEESDEDLIGTSDIVDIVDPEENETGYSDEDFHSKEAEAPDQADAIAEADPAGMKESEPIRRAASWPLHRPPRHDASRSNTQGLISLDILTMHRAHSDSDIGRNTKSLSHTHSHTATTMVP